MNKTGKWVYNTACIFFENGDWMAKLDGKEVVGLQTILDAFGDVGWELVSVVQLSDVLSGGGNFVLQSGFSPHNRSDTSALIAFFKYYQDPDSP